MNAIERILDRYFLSHFLKLSATKKIATNAIWLSGEKIIKIILGILVGLGVAKHLGPTSYGQISYGMLYFSFFLPFATLSLDQLIIRDLSQGKLTRLNIMGTALLMRVVGAFVAIGMAMAAVIYLQPNDHLIWIIVALNTSHFLLQGFEGCDLVFQTQLKSKYTTYAKTFTYVLFSAIKVYYIFVDGDLMAFVWIYTLEMFTGTLFLVSVYQWKMGDLFRWMPDMQVMKLWIKECPFLILQTFLVIIQGRADQFLLEKSLDIKLFGEYSLAARLIEMTYFLPVAIAASSASRIAEAKSTNETLYQEKLKNLYKVMIFLFLGMTIPIVLFGKTTIDSFFEGKFEVAGLIFVLLSSRFIYLNIWIVKNYFFVNENLNRFALIYVIVGIVVNISSNLLLIPRFGIYGAIVSMNISSIVTTFILDNFFEPMKKNRNILFSAIKDIFLLRNLKVV